MKRAEDFIQWMINHDLENPEERDQEWSITYWRVNEVRKAIINGDVLITEELMQQIRFSPSLHQFIVHSIFLKQAGVRSGTNT